MTKQDIVEEVRDLDEDYLRKYLNKYQLMKVRKEFFQKVSHVAALSRKYLTQHPQESKKQH